GDPRAGPVRGAAAGDDAPVLSGASLSPPLALLSNAGAARLVERVELRHVLVREAEVEEAGVLLDALAVGRLRDHRHVVLDAPAQQHLRGSATDALGD